MCRAQRASNPSSSNKPQALAEGIDHRDRGRVMVDAVAAPVFAARSSDRSTSFAPSSCRALIASTARALNDTGDKPGGQLEALLRATEHRVDAPLVDRQRHAARATSPHRRRSSVSNSWHSLPSSSIGCHAPVEVSAWTMPSTFGRTFCSASRMRSRSNTSPHGAFENGDLRAGAAGHFDHPLSEEALAADDHACRPVPSD